MSHMFRFSSQLSRRLRRAYQAVRQNVRILCDVALRGSSAVRTLWRSATTIESLESRELRSISPTVIAPNVTFRGDGAALVAIDDGDGTHPLDYSAYTTNIAADLGPETASYAISIASIHDVIGDAGDDSLSRKDGDATYVFDLDSSAGIDRVVDVADAGQSFLDFSTVELPITVDRSITATQIAGGANFSRTDSRTGNALNNTLMTTSPSSIDPIANETVRQVVFLDAGVLDPKTLIDSMGLGEDASAGLK